MPNDEVSQVAEENTLPSTAPVTEQAALSPNNRDNDGSDDELHATENVTLSAVANNTGAETADDPEQELRMLETWSMDQDQLERDVAEKADRAMFERENELDQKRLDKTIMNKEHHLRTIQRLEDKLYNPRTKISEKEKIRKEIDKLENVDIKALDSDLKDIRQRMQERDRLQQQDTENGDSSHSGRHAGESEHDYLVRTGKITPFSSTFMGNPNLQNVVNDTTRPGMSHQQLRLPGAELEEISEEEEEMPSRKKRKVKDDDNYELSDVSADEEANDEENQDDEDSNFELSDVETSSKQRKPTSKKPTGIEDIEGLDDGDMRVYKRRLEAWVERRKQYRDKVNEKKGITEEDDEREEWMKPHPLHKEFNLDGVFKVPGDVYTSLFDYQKTGVQWQWELYSQNVGGIIGDEMGLGKTIQIVSFIAGLHYSGLLKKPVIIVCPATVMKQWVNEFHRWWPPLRVVILHSIGSGMDLKKEERLEHSLEVSENGSVNLSSMKKLKGAQAMVNSVVSKGHVIITTYVGVRIYSNLLLPNEWGYAVLDEGHKIRNPNSDISLVVKGLRTAHRIILSGTPIQNNLTELWSLFDFVFPGRLGTLPVFQTEFSLPINMGGYANATNVQVQTAYKCAVVLRDLISPYLLRRMKVDVAADLPKKTEKVLFCKLTKVQKDAYVSFLKSKELKSVIEGKRKVLFGIDILRKICNHPDLPDRDTLAGKPGYNYGAPEKSGKMQVVKALVELWKTQGHRTLLFCQTRQTMDILNAFLIRLAVKFVRMDGTTPIGQRQALVDQFNEDASYDLFLLTTRVGGLGVNLTGADRVIIFDPDWNPSTDVQARERAWRLGQKRDVSIYRLMTAGTIEEKIYHRQIFKQFLTNKILQDPKQRRFFKMNDLHDLFTLDDSEDRDTETGRMFSGTETRIAKSNTPAEEELPPEETSSSTDKSNEKRDNDDDFMQVASMNGVAGLEDFHTNDADKKRPSEEPAGAANADADDDRFMDGLLASSGVYSTLQHDSIMSESHPDRVLVEREASRMAQQAADALRASRKIARRADIGVPTWTGKHGAAGRLNAPRPGSRAPGTSSGDNTPPNPDAISSASRRAAKASRMRNGDGWSSGSDGSARSTPEPAVPRSSTGIKGTGAAASLLQTLRFKRDLERSPGLSHASAPRDEPPVTPDSVKNIELVRRYLAAAPGGSAKSKDIIGNCGIKMNGAQDVANVREMLKQIAVWNKTAGTWTLKDDLK